MHSHAIMRVASLSSSPAGVQHGQTQAWQADWLHASRSVAGRAGQYLPRLRPAPSSPRGARLPPLDGGLGCQWRPISLPDRRGT